MSANSEDRKPWALKRGITRACLVHLVFIGQLLIAMERKGLVLPEFGVIFFPHALLMYCLPPGFTFSGGPTNVLRLIGKVIDAAPASLLYGLILQFLLGAAWRLLSGFDPRRRRRHG